MTQKKPSIAIIGGSGFYEMPDLKDTEKVEISTPFGEPSSPIFIGDLGKLRIAFLARHGEGHFITPTEVNYRANIYALKSLGVERILSISACGSLRDDYAPGDIVIPDQLFDFTRARKNSFFGNGLVAHVSVAEPFCIDFSSYIEKALQNTGATVHNGGNFITIEGPRFSTRAESNVFRSWGMDIIGMTTSPEAFLAREAEICYGVMAHVTDYDVWHIREEPVTVEMVIETLHKNTQIAKQAVRNLVNILPQTRWCKCSHALSNAIITQDDVIPEGTMDKLSLLIGKYLG
jgi:5'-methylthioadenosine phosphorylase